MQKLAVFGLLLLVIGACRTSKETTTTRVLTSADYPYIRTFHSAVRFKSKGQYKEAIQAFDSCFTARPTDDAAAFGLAQCYLLVNDKTKSSQYTEIASKLDPNNIWYTQELAYMYYNQSKFEEAKKCFAKMIEKEPKNIDWLFGYADLLRRTNKPLEAVSALDKMEDQLGVLPDISVQKFELYMAAKQEEKALNELTKARKVYPDDLQLIGTLVDYYFQKRETTKAQEMLVELVKNDPSNGRANLALGELYLRQFKKPEAYTYFKAAFEGEGVDVDTKMKVLVMLMEQQTKIEPELVELTDIMAIKHPSDAKSYSIKGDVLLQNGNKKEALAAYKQALKFDDSRYPIWNQVLLLEYELRDFDALYLDARACSALFPSLPNVQLLYTIACLQNGRYEETIDAASIGRELVVNDPKIEAEFYAQSGDAYFHMKQHEAGITDYEKALKLDPSNLLTKNNYAMRLALAGKQLDKAMNLIEEVISLAPDQAPFLDTKGMVLFQKEKYNDAKNLFLKVNELQPNDRNYVEHLGDVYFKTGDTNKALELWKSAQQLGSKNKMLDKKIQTKNYVAPSF